MPPKKKQCRTTEGESQRLVEDFLATLNEEDDPFLGHSFISDNEDIDFRQISDDSDGSDDEVYENSHTELDDERAADMLGEAPAENIGDLPDKGTDAVDNTEQDVPAAAELPRKQKFRNLDAVCDENNYEALPPQRKKRHTYKNAKGTIVMNYDT